MIRTVCGDIPKGEYGSVLMHEHIQCVSNDMFLTFGDKWLDTDKLEARAVSILLRLKEKLGLGVYVDGTAIDLGRNVPMLQRIAEKTGVHIVASTGFYYYPSMLSCQRSAEELSAWLLYECETGMEGTDIRAGILKCAADGVMTPDMAKRLEAVAAVQSKTGLPMYAHCSHTGEIAYDMMKIFAERGVDPEKTVLGHASRRLDVNYLETLLKEGYYICIDQSFAGSESRVAEAVYALCERGYEKKLLFSHDRAIYNDFECESYLGMDCEEEVHVNRYCFLQNRLIPAFEALGCRKAQCELFLHKNAMDILNF